MFVIDEAAEEQELVEDEFMKGTSLQKLLDELVSEDEAPQGFCVSKTKGGWCRRLHFVGGCFRVPGEHYRSYESFGQKVPDSHLYDVRCRDCFPADRVAIQKAEREAEVSDSSGASSSSSSSASADAANAQN